MGNRPTGVPCSQCGRGIVYNGNYFCESCGWRMTPPGEKGYSLTLHNKLINGMQREAARDDPRGLHDGLGA